MSKMLKQAILPSIALSMMLVIPAAAVEPSEAISSPLPDLPQELAFQIPMNNYCSPENPLDLSFQLSNAADTPADITLHFYQRDGSEFKEQGSSYVEIESTLLPGTPFTLQAHETGLYHINFGNHKRCSERIYVGKIEVNSGQASLLAGGWVATREGMKTIGTEHIIVNERKAFQLAQSGTVKSQNN